MEVAMSAAACQESSLGWPTFMVVRSMGLAYLAAALFYQLATFGEHPETSSAWLGRRCSLLRSR